MSLERIKPPGWTTNEKLTHGQITDVDANIENALDKRVGHTDTLGSFVTVSVGLKLDTASNSSLESGASLTLVSGCTLTGVAYTGTGITLDSYDAATPPIRLAASRIYGYVARSVTRAARGPIVAIPLVSGGANRVALGGILETVTLTGSTSLADYSLQTLDLPHGATLTGYSVRVDPSRSTPPSGGGSAVQAGVYQYDTTTGANTLIGGSGVVDTTSGGSYGVPHALSKSGLSIAIDATRYVNYLRVDAELDSTAGTVDVFPATWTATVTSIDEGAS